MLYAAQNKYYCKNLSNYFGCATERKDINHDRAKTFFAKLDEKSRSAFAYDTVDCYYYDRLCRLALRRAEEFKRDFK